MNNNSTHRLFYIDNLRAFATCLVVLDHVVFVCYRLLYSNAYSIYNNLSLLGRFCMCISFELSRLGVPLFLMISGALLLSRSFDTSNTLQFYKKNTLRLVVINEIWVVFYWIISYFFVVVMNMEFVYVENSVPDFSLKTFFEQLFMIKRAHYPNSWYMPMIIGIYLFIPLVSVIVRSEMISSKILFGILGVQIALQFVPTDIQYAVTLLQTLGIPTGGLNFRSYVIDTTFIGMYGIYLICGYFIDQYRFARKQKMWLVIFSCLGFVVYTIIMKKSYDYGNGINIFGGNDSALQLLVTVTIFILFKTLANREFKTLSFIARKSFLIYLLHFPIIHLLNHYFAEQFAWDTKYLLFLWLGSLAICIILAWLIPVNRLTKLVFNIT